MSDGKIYASGKESLRYREWKKKNKYFRKLFSILGDSISTLDGYNPEGYHLYYAADKCEETGVKEISDTWWGKVIDFFGGELLVNNSWSGSCVTKLSNQEGLFPSGCSDERTSGLHTGKVMPDVIIVYLGTNDWGTGVDPRLADCVNRRCVMWAMVFETACEKMLEKLKANYSGSEIWCVTLSETEIHGRPNFRFPYRLAGYHIDCFNDVIRRSAEKFQCKLIDLYRRHIPYESVDGTHPTAKGMSGIAAEIIHEAVGDDADMLLDFD